MPFEYTSAYAPMQSNAQYGQPTVMGQGSQDAMHQAMLNQQNQYNNQSAQIAGRPSGLSSFLAPMQQMMMANALRQGGTGNNSVELPKSSPQMTGVAGMGDSMGTGVYAGNNYGNFGQMNPNQTGGFGIQPVSNMPVADANGLLMPNN